MSNIIDSIQVSGVTYTIQGSGGTQTVELTQAEYDALVSGGTVDANTYYIITDATPIDISNYWTSAQTESAINEATSGKVNTSSVVSSVTSASTDSEIPTAKAVYDAVGSGGGGGTTYSAGRGIDITNNTISVSLPISAGTGTNNIIGNDTHNTVNGYCAVAMGTYSVAKGQGAVAIGELCTAGSNQYAHGDAAFGNGTSAIGYYSFAACYQTQSTNSSEASFGRYNVSNKANTIFGDSGNTLFSVGNGTADNARHNAFEIRQNGDIYLNDGTNDVKLQDTITATAANTTALGGLSLVKLTQAEYDALVSGGTVDASTLYIITNVVN